MSRFVLVIIAQLVATDSNRHLSRIVRNSTRSSIVVVELVVFYAKYCQASSTYKALHDPWNHIIFGLCCVSLAEYLLVLKVYFSLVVDNTIYHGYCKNYFSLVVQEE